MTKGGVRGRGEESSKFLFMSALSTHLLWVTYTLYLRLFQFKWSTLKGPCNAFFKPPYLLWIYSQHVKEKKSKRSYDNGHKAKLSVREISKYMQNESYSQLEIECLEMPHFALPWHHSVFRSQWHFQRQCSCRFSLLQEDVWINLCEASGPLFNVLHCYKKALHVPSQFFCGMLLYSILLAPSFSTF